MICYYDDLDAGFTFVTGTVEVTEEEIRAFARQFDPQPFHLDHERAAASFFGRLVASGWHTTALTMKLLVEGETTMAAGVIGLGVDNIRWPRPVLPGDVLRAKGEVLERRLSASQPGWGIVRTEVTTTNQRGEVVQQFTTNQLVPTRDYYGNR